MKKWAVQAADYYESECYRDTLEMDVKLYDSKLDAIDELERIIRDD